ncbi:MAG: NUDIX domain-containing protein [Propionibacteriales bacterium]|nr:NUDIX domain-containing protein [Propionibacteriales bacterium]
MSERPVIEVVAALVTRADGRTLLVRKRGTALFMNPGGKPEAGESHVEALTRELDEELGLVVDPARLEPLGTIRTVAANEPGHDLVAHCFRLPVDDPAHEVAAEIEEARWVDPHAPDVALAPLAAEHLLPLLTSR